MFAARKQTPDMLEPCGSAEHADCGLRLTLDRLGEKWTVMTIAELSAGPRRYREIERALSGVTQRMLTLTLRRLERDGFVDRHVEPTNPPSVTYSLTPPGVGFSSIAAGLVTWSQEHKSQILAARRLRCATSSVICGHLFSPRMSQAPTAHRIEHRHQRVAVVGIAIFDINDVALLQGVA